MDANKKAIVAVAMSCLLLIGCVVNPTPDELAAAQIWCMSSFKAEDYAAPTEQLVCNCRHDTSNACLVEVRKEIEASFRRHSLPSYMIDIHVDMDVILDTDTGTGDGVLTIRGTVQ